MTDDKKSKGKTPQPDKSKPENKAKPGSLKEKVANALGKQTEAQTKAKEEEEALERAENIRTNFASSSANARRAGTSSIRNPGVFTRRRTNVTETLVRGGTGSGSRGGRTRGGTSTGGTSTGSGSTGSGSRSGRTRGGTSTGSGSTGSGSTGSVITSGPLVRTPVTSTRIATLTGSKITLSEDVRTRIQEGLTKTHKRTSKADDDDPITLGDYLGAIRRELEVAGAVARTDDPDIPQLELSSAEVAFSFLVEAVSDEQGVQISTNQEKMEKAEAHMITSVKVHLRDPGLEEDQKEGPDLKTPFSSS